MSFFPSQLRLSSSLLRRRTAPMAAAAAARPFTSCEGSRPTIVHKRSLDILHDPWFNKGTAFSMTERDRLDLRGLLPPNVMSSEQQIERFMVDLKRLQVNARDGPSDTHALAKWRILNRLHDRNETMYYQVLVDNIEEYAPIVYTPTVGLVCQNYSGLFRRPRGMYFSAADRGEMMSMVYNWPADQVDMIVVTDGSRILGLGDLGVQGIGIAIGKLDLYVAAAGINPQRIIEKLGFPPSDFNSDIIDDLGLQEHRLDGEEYLSVIDEFMEAVFTRWPNVIVQFEDFQSKWAFKLLQRYRHNYRMFNDDVQGTAGVAIAGLLGAVRAQGRPMIDFPKQKIVVAGAGSAGIGVLNAARKTMSRMLGNNESAFESARSQFWVVDAMGLITENRMNVDPDALPFARKEKEIGRQGLSEGSSLAEVVKKVKPDVLLGLSAVGGLFSKEVLEALKDSTSTRPAIFAMSNPTKNAECTPEEAFSILGDHIIFASGSPFNDVVLGDGGIGHSNQGNNMYLFPGIGLGTLLSGARIISDGMLQAAAECIRDITKEVAAAVVREAVAEDLAEGYRDMDARELQRLSQTGKIESALDQLINVELGYCPLEVPKSPYQAMKFLCRSWSPSASDFFHILSSNDDMLHVPSLTSTPTKDGDDCKPEIYDAVLQLPLHQKPQSNNVIFMNANNTWMSSGTTSSSLRRHKPLQNLWTNMGSMKGWLREAREKKREAARLQAAQIQGALSVAQLAAAVAGFVADGGGACGDDPKMNAAVAEAAALVATVCAEAAESVGARRGRVESTINVGSAMRGSADA
ncbi:hypothetical protein QJS04_geneDACA008734 [Acorus gramineus]|uniref:Malic enzyme n=2 Tax=Magnoliopsida TaxID=3398 RepID=A0AAV9ABH5_ACOGR|nr:hypothetical protein QJS04_geneDACA008734 [Acorus gramineus]